MDLFNFSKKEDIVVEDAPVLQEILEIPVHKMHSVSHVLLFILSNNIIGEIFTSRKAGYTRLARVVIFFTIFQAIITLSAVLNDLGLDLYMTGLTASAGGLLIEPLLTFLLYSGKD